MRLSSTQRERMRRTQQQAMSSTAVHMVYTAVEDTATGEITYSYVDGDTFPCGIAHGSGSAQGAIDSVEGGPTRETVVTQRRVRLPVQAAVGPSDRLRFTHEQGEALTEPIVYEVVGDALRGPSAVVVNVRRVTL